MSAVGIRRHEIANVRPKTRPWRFLSSIRLALVLILGIAGLCLVGALLLQAPAEATTSGEAYSQWLKSVAEPRFGFWVWPLQLFGLFSVFRSPLFLAAGVLLIVNIVACSVTRWKNLARATALTARLDDGFYKSGTGTSEFTVETGLPETAERIAGALKRAGYRLRTEMAPNSANIAADKNRFSRYGTLLSHLSLILFVVAVFVGNLFGFKDTSFIVPEGAARPVGHSTGLSLRLDSFTDEYWQDGVPKDYRSQVALIRDGEEVERGSIRVNHPMVYDGVNFYQSSFGPAALMQVRGPSGQEIFNGVVALSNPLTVEGLTLYSGGFALSDAGLSVQLAGSGAGAMDPVEARRELAILVKENGSATPLATDIIERGVPRNIAGLQFTYVEASKYSGFQVSRDPGSVLIWIASAILLAGLAMVLYFSYQRVWVQAKPLQRNTRIRLRVIGPRDRAAVSELRNLEQGIERKSPGNQREEEHARA